MAEEEGANVEVEAPAELTAFAQSVAQTGPFVGSLAAAEASAQQGTTTETAEAADSAATERVTTQRTTAVAAAAGAEDARIVQAAVDDREQSATRNTLRGVQDMQGMEMIMLFFALLLGLGGRTDGLGSDQALRQLAEAFGSDGDQFVNTVRTYQNGDRSSSSAYAAATSLGKSVDPASIDMDAARATISEYGGSDNPLLALIYEHESGGDYNRVYSRDGSYQTMPLTDMTINEVLAWQDSYVADGSPSSAAGALQVIRGTLRTSVDEMGLTGNEIFDEEMQDRIAYHLLDKRGYDEYLRGEIDETTFGRSLAQEWASMPVLAGTQGQQRYVQAGESYYASDGLNRSGTAPATVMAAMRLAREDYLNPTAPGAFAGDPAIAEQFGNTITLAAPMGTNARMTSDFGPRDLRMSPMHRGIDLVPTEGGSRRIEAQQPMVFLHASHEAGFGHRAAFLLGHDDSGTPITVHYAHGANAVTHLTPGDVVLPGDYIMEMGNTGRSTGAHLDVRVHVGDHVIDPQLAMTSDLSDSKNNERLIAAAEDVLDGTARTGTYGAVMAPALRTAAVQRGVAELNAMREEAALLAQQQAAEDRLAAEAAVAAEEEETLVADAGSAGDGSTYDEAGVTAAATPAAVTIDDELAPSKATPVASLSAEFGSPDQPQGTDQVAAANETPPSEEDTAPEEVILAANGTGGAPGLGRTGTAV